MERVLRCWGGDRRLRPRRARCRGCTGTHVLLPDVALLRRQDGVEVSSFGTGYLFYVHQSALDSRGTYYTGDVGGTAPRPGPSNGKSVQKFNLQAR